MIESRLLLALLSREIPIFNYPKRGTKITKESVERRAGASACGW